MGVGKYSPTVVASYHKDQNWWERNGGGYGNGKNPESNNDDGYDSYGYADCTGPDRAGHTESDYGSSGEWYEDSDGNEHFEYHLYEDVYYEWCNKLLGDLA